jgi:cellulose synthase/poly-beta-1,6-N-acetylglucosamine synthase-like glycosyltransferase
MNVAIEIAEGVFWTSFIGVVYTYVLYPLLLVIATAIKKMLTRHNVKFTHRGNNSSTPFFVSVVVPAHNEERVLENKLRNLQRTVYPHDRIEFLVGSDGSTDRTADILRTARLPGLKARIFPERRGKAAVLNELIPKADGEIIILSDANTFCLPTTIEKLVQHFSDPSIGAVCGELTLDADSNTVGGVGEGYYWRYENRMKQMESDLCTTVGATGAVYAIRKNLFKPLPEHKPVMDDFVIPLNIAKQGYAVRYEPAASAHERPSNSVIGEFRRKVRIGAANFYGLSEFVSLLHPRYGFVAFALWSRKILRWCVPFFLIMTVAASLVLAGESRFFYVVSVLEGAFCAIALCGVILEKANLKIGAFGLPYYFLAMNLALFLGFIKFLIGREPATWDVIRS